MKTRFVCLVLFALAGGAVALAGGAPGDETPEAVNEITPPVEREARLGDVELRAVFHLGKIWSKDLKLYPALEKRLLVVDLSVTNRGSGPVSLYLDEVWVHLDEEDQRMERLHAEEVGPKVYAPPNQVLPDDPHRDASRVQVYDPQMTGGTSGVTVDFSKLNKSGAPVISLEKFTLALFTKEFGTNFLKPGQTAEGFLYFHLPWEIERLEGMQLHLLGFLGGTEEAILPLPAAPPPAKKPAQ